MSSGHPVFVNAGLYFFPLNAASLRMSDFHAFSFCNFEDC